LVSARVRAPMNARHPIVNVIAAASSTTNPAAQRSRIRLLRLNCRLLPAGKYGTLQVFVPQESCWR
jgi:hypothetical protein